MKKTILLFVIMVSSAMMGWGQATMFSDDFSTNQSTSWTTSSQIGSSSWYVSVSGVDFGARRNTSPAQLELTNDASGSTNVNGWAFAYVTTSDFSSPYNPTLSLNTGLVTWTFNMRQIRADPSGFTSGSYGVAFILGGTSTSVFNAGNGYAIVLGQSGSTDPIRLAKYANGLSGTGNITNILSSNTSGLTDFGAEYVSVKVTYNPLNNTWELFLRNDGSSTFSDPETGTLTSQGTATDNTYTSLSLTYCGGYWSGSTGANQTSFFDNVKVTEIEAPTTQSSDISFTNVDQTQMDVSWTNGNGSKRVVKINTSNSFTAPADGTDPTPNTVYGGSEEQVIYNNSTNYVTVTGLTASTTYWFRVYEYNSSGTSTKYLTTEGLSGNPNSQATSSSSNDNTSKVEDPATQILAGDIASTATSSGSAVSVFSFKVHDLGTSDEKPTHVTQVTIKKSSGSATWSSTLAGAELWDGESQIATGTISITDNDITFPITSGNLDIANNSNKDITLKIYLKSSGIVDNSTMVFQVSKTAHGFTADASGSTFASDFGSSVTGNIITVRVTAAKMIFSSVPTSVQSGTNFTVSVNATDANNNVDADENGSVTLSKNNGDGNISAAGGLTKSLSSGLYSWTDVQNNAASGSFTLNCSHSGSLSSAISSSINISQYGIADFGFTATSANWGTNNVNWKQWDGTGWNTTPSGAPTINDNVFILSGNTCTVEASSKTCKNLVVESTGKLYSNQTSNRYISVFGNITCDGTIGNGTSLDGISFYAEGSSCLISGSGSFDIARLGKATVTSPVTNVTVSKIINLRYGGTVLYNNINNSTLNISVTSGCSLNCIGDGTTAGSVSLNGSSGASGNRGGTITVNGTLTISGALILNSNASTIPTSFVVNGTGVLSTNTVTCDANNVVGSSLIINNGGKLNFSGSTADVWGTYSTTNNNYTFESGSTVEYSYAGAQTIKNPGNYSNLTISGSGTKTMGEAVVVNGDLSLTAGTLTIGAGQTLTVSGTLTNSVGNGGLVIADGGSLITNGTVSGGATVSRTISGPAWHQMSAPVTGQTIFLGYTDMYAWDEVNYQWLNHNGGSFPDATYLPGKGYLVSWAAGATKDFAGTLNSGDYATGTGSIPALTYTSGKGNGFNLMGNPYPSALNGSIDIWTKTNVDNSIWVYNNGSYLTWNGTTGTLTGGIIPAMQGFWVKANATGASLTIPNTARTHSTQSYYKSAEALQDMILLSVEGNGYKDGIVVNFNDEATEGYDGAFDVLKMYGDAAAPQFFCQAGEKELSIDVLPYTRTRTIPLGLKVGYDNTYTLQVKENTFYPSVSIVLEDLKTGQSIDLQTHPEYTFNALSSDNASRFKLHFGGALGVEDPKTAEALSIYANDNQLCIAANTTLSGDVYVYNMVGQLLLQQKLENSALTRIAVNGPSGYYLVKVVTGQKTFTGKVFIR